MQSDTFFATKLKRLLDRFEEVVGADMMQRPENPPSLPDSAGGRDAESVARVATRKSNRMNIGPRTLQVQAFLVAERSAKRPFPRLHQITEHMGWPQDGRHRQAKDALKRLSAAGKLPKFRTPKQ